MSQRDREGGVSEAWPQVIESGRDRRPRPASWGRPMPRRRRRRAPPPRSVSDLPQAPRYVPWGGRFVVQLLRVMQFRGMLYLCTW